MLFGAAWRIYICCGSLDGKECSECREEQQRGKSSASLATLLNPDLSEVDT